jgi:hypothetical protein
MAIDSNVVGSTASGAASGAAIGSFIPGVGTAIGAGIGGLLGFASGLSSSSAARGQQAMAQAQLDEARRARELALGFAGPSSVELQGQQQLLALQEQVLGRANRELDFLSRNLDLRSPGALQAGQGLFSQLIARQRLNQRSALESQLRERLGAGYATSSIGQQALQAFDQGTVDVGVQAIPQFLQTAYGAIQAPLSLEDAIKRRQIGAAVQTPIAPYAGAGNLAQVLQGQQMTQQIGSLFQLGGMVAGRKAGAPNINYVINGSPFLNPENQFQQPPSQLQNILGQNPVYA